MLVDALHAALEDREIAFDGVRAGAAPAVLLAAMVDGQVLRKLAANFDVPRPLIGRERAAARDIGFDIGSDVGDRRKSTWNERERPPRSTSVSTIIRSIFSRIQPRR